MRAVVQRVADATVTVDDLVVASLGTGLLVLVGVVPTDSEREVATLAAKLVAMRVFPDEDGRMNRSIHDIGGSILIVSQFTLVGDITKGRRPSFSGAAPPEHARGIIDRLVASVRNRGVSVETGQFGAMMNVSLTNWGPVTFVIDEPAASGSARAG
ncbi:MAG: D-aminoacyl-tRNA deacylase [Acidimicrobiia bacterium]|nr:MAG: D-aminoacyl-tRNA deacylase [Acidimicrobiia bacterium]